MTEESDVRILIAEMRSDQKANSEANLRVAAELSSVAKELHQIGKAFTAQEVVVGDHKQKLEDHEKRIRSVEDLATSSSVIDKYRDWFIKAFITLAAGAVFYAVFAVSK